MVHGERFNTITHLIGAVFSLIGFGALLVVGIHSGDMFATISYTVFGLSLVLLYVSSTLYHIVASAQIKAKLQKLDHVAIYVLIAGTYTPYTLVSLKDNDGLGLLVFVWSLAIIGILLDVFKRNRTEWLQITIYLMMGWACVAKISALKLAMDWQGFWLLVSGGLLYSIGVIFYVLDGKKLLKHAHGIWHIFVLLGSLAHFVSIIGFVR